MTRIVDKNSENHPPEPSAPPHSTPAADGNSKTVVAAPAPPPLPAHLQDLTDRARGYVEAASSANTRRAYTADWTHFTAWCRRQNLSALPPDPEVVGLYITACAPAVPLARLRAAPSRIRSRPSSGASPPSDGTARSVGRRSIARTERLPR